MMTVLALILNNTLLIAILAIGGGLLGSHWAQSGKLRQARIAVWTAFVASSLLLVVHLAMTAFAARAGAVGSMGLNALMSVLWGYFTWRDLRLLKMLRGG